VEGFDGTSPSGFGEGVISVTKNGGLSLEVALREEFSALRIPDDVLSISLVDDSLPSDTINSGSSPYSNSKNDVYRLR